ncbi:PREDICTED: fibrillin-1-like isoform X11 [Acropora digitifera]|uniref:fibrillin-1-like isoform X11 n=1 Tax=Acropora digitifera TaxID=70779 RepID=UPI00077A8A95|nr:PREDICTED: fibrillin-1-like isoform X11 [Acropora digitifera]
MSSHMCEFNDRTKEATPEDFIPDPDRYYFGKRVNRVPLGSIPELAAESCKEIKMSEKEATSGKYWLSSIKPGIPLFAFCNMTTEDINECTASPSACHLNAQCNNTIGSYHCTCNPGYTGNGKTCTDVNECTSSLSVCHMNAHCSNTIGSYQCACNPGYTGNGKTCTDINECTALPSACHLNAQCNNTIGSYHCTCNPGYTGNGITCTDINECTSSPSACHVNAQCTNTFGSYLCACNPGYTGNGKTCTDINECTSSPSSCDVNAQCTNTIGSYYCVCNPGYTGNGKTCTDINECTASSPVCHVSAQCNNTLGSYRCICDPGYTYNGKRCTDIDECTALPSACHVNAHCNNAIGSYRCACNLGYTGNGKTCTDINECSSSPFPCHVNAQCNNTIGSYRCACNLGYTGNGTTCTDINECSSSPSACHVNAQCNNTIGSYSCVCKLGYTGNGKTCTAVRASSCNEIFQNQTRTKSQVYTLMLGSRNISVYCFMGDFGCGSGGWTLVMKTDGTKNTFHYSSSFWSDRQAYNLAGGKTGFDKQETKLPSYWETHISKICLGMRSGSTTRFVVIHQSANSLYTLIADGTYRAVSLGRNNWKSLVGPEGSLQPNCNNEGFNVVGTSSHSKARIGIIANNENDCLTCDSRIGYGTGGFHDDSNTCGNEARVSPDNGDKHIKAMGYILVQ